MCKIQVKTSDGAWSEDHTENQTKRSATEAMDVAWECERDFGWETRVVDSSGRVVIGPGEYVARR
jgi:hypothetical protein